MQRRDKYEKMIVVLSKNHTSKVSFLEKIFIGANFFAWLYV